MVWFKPQTLQERQYIFGFQQSLGCFITPSNSISCSTSDDYDLLEANSSLVTPGQWTHLTVSGSPSASSYLQIENNQAILAQDFKNYLTLKQVSDNWAVCLSSCDSNFRFKGGIRDFVWLNQQISTQTATRLKNNWLLSDSSILAYYRFTEKNFFYDEARY